MLGEVLAQDVADPAALAGGGESEAAEQLALASDCFYVIDSETSRPAAPGPAHEAFNQDLAQARESIRKLAALDPSAAWPGHGDPLTGDVRAQLERAAEA